MFFYKINKKKNKVYIINNKYVLKIANKERLASEYIFLSLYKSEKMEKIVFYKKNSNFIIYKYQNIHSSIDEKNIKVLDFIIKIKEIINIYKTYELEGYGDILNKVDSWEQFLMNEIDSNSKWMKDDIKKYETAKISVKNILRYQFDKKIIHGDLGIYNIIVENNEIKNIIDPRTIIGDSLYDIIFFIFSKPNFVCNLDINAVINYINEPKEKVLDLMVVVLYIRIARQRKNKQNVDEYEKMWNKLLYYINN